ncbi:MAG TPA: hypothetical protein VKA84_11780 [Gemmatimonadaceae bacterium]|nr:hypothetical protein [Gemmatimonadaceae bacterium]
MRIFQAPDGSQWAIQIRAPGASNAMVVFLNSGGREAHRDRYAWYLSSGPESRSVTARLKPAQVLQALTDDQLRKLFRRSFPLGTGDNQESASEATYPAVASGKN